VLLQIQRLFKERTTRNIEYVLYFMWI